MGEAQQIHLCPGLWGAPPSPPPDSWVGGAPTYPWGTLGPGQALAQEWGCRLARPRNCLRPRASPLGSAPGFHLSPGRGCGRAATPGQNVRSWSVI